MTPLLTVGPDGEVLKEPRRGHFGLAALDDVIERAGRLGRPITAQNELEAATTAKSQIANWLRDKGLENTRYVASLTNGIVPISASDNPAHRRAAELQQDLVYLDNIINNGNIAEYAKARSQWDEQVADNRIGKELTLLKGMYADYVSGSTRNGRAAVDQASLEKQVFKVQDVLQSLAKPAPPFDEDLSKLPPSGDIASYQRNNNPAFRSLNLFINEASATMKGLPFDPKSVGATARPFDISPRSAQALASARDTLPVVFRQLAQEGNLIIYKRDGQDPAATVTFAADQADGAVSAQRRRIVTSLLRMNSVDFTEGAAGLKIPAYRFTDEDLAFETALRNDPNVVASRARHIVAMELLRETDPPQAEGSSRSAELPASVTPSPTPIGITPSGLHAK